MSLELLLRAKLKHSFLSKLAATKSPDQLLKEIEQWALDYCQDLRATTYIGQRDAMPLDVGFTWEAAVITPLGPRKENWLRKTAEDGYHGQDFFAWWNLD